MFHVKEEYRIKNGLIGSDKRFGNNGAFQITKNRVIFYIIASDGEGWDHVSVHCKFCGIERTPTWDEMCFIKSVFWDEDDCVIQYHPSKKEYVNLHKYTLHLWRPTNSEFPIPNKILVGF